MYALEIRYRSDGPWLRMTRKPVDWETAVRLAGSKKMLTDLNQRVRITDFKTGEVVDLPVK